MPQLPGLTVDPLQHCLSCHKVLRACIAVQLVLQGVLDLLLQILHSRTASSIQERFEGT